MTFPPAPYFAATETQQAGPKQFKQGTEVTKQTTAGAIESTRFTLNGFTYFFTFFSKFFSSFPHGTCSLSVSNEYLALEGIYLPFCTAVPSNTTLSTGSMITSILINWQLQKDMLGIDRTVQPVSKNVCV